MSRTRKVKGARRAQLPKLKSRHFQLYPQNFASLARVQELKQYPSGSQAVRYCLDLVAELLSAADAGAVLYLRHADGKEEPRQLLAKRTE